MTATINDGGKIIKSAIINEYACELMVAFTADDREITIDRLALLANGREVGYEVIMLRAGDVRVGCGWVVIQ